MARAVLIAALAALAALFVACSSDAERPRVKPSAEPRTAPGTAPGTAPPGAPGDAPADAEAGPHVAAIGGTSHLSPELQRAFAPAGQFTPMGPPQASDWLASHPEEPQTYDDYIASRPNLPNGQRRVIYLLPIGDFPPGTPTIASLAELVKVFFTLEVRIMPRAPIGEVKARTRIHDHTHKRQLLAPDVLKWLVGRLPDDAYALMAITMEDLYPEPSWNFVFGMASLRERVGVQSFARQDAAFFGEPRPADWQKLALRRATWTLIHEISHMFGLSHCVFWECIVSGSNNQAEADRRPLHPCPVCARKLQFALDFDPAQRETALAATLRKLGIDDEAAWSEARAAWIRDGKR
ncbi:MAG TPA: archaemetzincin [Kofleriaceae bacterium]|nr:archaemetzincin [Kofleriaceae bacterium]